MSRRLAVHNSACNHVYVEYQECEKEYPIRKYFGYCDELHKKLTACIKEQRTIQQKRNSEISKSRLQKLHSEDSINKEE